MLHHKLVPTEVGFSDLEVRQEEVRSVVPLEIELVFELQGRSEELFGRVVVQVDGHSLLRQLRWVLCARGRGVSSEVTITTTTKITTTKTLTTATTISHASKND